MKKTMKKGESFRSFDIKDGKVISTMMIGDHYVSNPTEEILAADGWKEVVNTERPVEEPADGYYYEPRWIEQGNKYVKEWVLTKAEEAEEWMPEEE